MVTPFLITPREAAERLGLYGSLADPERAIREAARRGHLVAREVAGLTMIHPDSVARFVPIAEAARRLGLVGQLADPGRAVLNMIRRGDLRGASLARFVFVTADSLAEFIDGDTGRRLTVRRR